MIWNLRLAALACALFATALTAVPSSAQEIKLRKPVPQAPARTTPARAPAKPQQPGSWLATCVGGARSAEPDCRTEQRSLLQNGQLLAAVTVSVPHDTRKATILVQTPFGLALRSGISLQLDGRPPVRLDVQTCDQGGCYAATVMSNEFLNAMLASRKLTISFAALNQKTVAVPLSLQGFADAYQRIK